MCSTNKQLSFLKNTRKGINNLQKILFSKKKKLIHAHAYITQFYKAILDGKQKTAKATRTTWNMNLLHIKIKDEKCT